jgi:glutamate-ammonia-ligase adenylyltransferase
MHDPFDPLFAPHGEPTPAGLSMLTELGFLDAAAAWRRLHTLHSRAAEPAAAATCLRRLLIGLWESPAPDAALVSFERYFAQASDPTATFRYLNAYPRAVEVLIKIFGGSQYLTETLLCNPEYLDRLTQHRRLAEMKSREEFVAAALEAAGVTADLSGQWDALRQFQRWEILRIGACDAFGLMDLRSATVQLSLLADALIRASLHLWLASKPGFSASRATRSTVDGKTSEVSEVFGSLAGDLTGFCVLALGKLGGEELNYSSDIDLVFLAEEQAEHWSPLAQGLIRALQTPTAEGFLYRVDMRLRPWGRSGALVSTTAGFLAYLRRDAELWERQALLKARVVGGDEALGARVIAECQPIVFAAAPQQVRESVRAAKRRIEAALERGGRQWGEVKSGQGSLRDIEFLTQMLQLLHGGRHPQVRSANTLDGLIRLADFGLIQADEYRQLTGGYQLLRTIEHSLQLMHNRAEHALPTDRRELTYLARRLDFPGPDEFVAHYERHVTAVRTIFERLVLRDEGQTIVEEESAVATVVSVADDPPRFSKAEQKQHRAWLQQITPERPMAVHAELLDGPLWRVTVLGIDQPGDLSMICGLLFVYGCDIVDGLVTTGEHPALWPKFQPRSGQNRGQEAGTPRSPARDFVDAFTIRPPCDSTEPAVWINYETDLLELMLLSRNGRDGDAQGRLAKRVAAALEDGPSEMPPLSPVEIEFDNESSAEATVMHIRADDTIGFLYELTNAFALTGINIDRMVVRSQGQRVSDTLYVTNALDGAKLYAVPRQQELRAAVVLIKHFTHLLPRSPNPEAALLHFRSFVRDLFQQPDWPEQLSSLERPDVLGALAQLLGVSDFLWEDFLRLQSANLLPLLRDVSGLQTQKSKDELAAELSAALPKSLSRDDAVRELNAFKDREMFRIDMRHILGRIAQFEQFSEELSDVAEVVVQAALELVTRELQPRHGRPRTAAGKPAALCVAALGKCGGRELGFASDIELLFVYSNEGETDGAKRISNATYFQRVVERITHTIQAPREGVFHIDLRLRPYGKAGQLAVSLAAFEHYFAANGPAWPYERQALVKLRPIAGDAALGRQLIAARDRLLFTGASWDVAALRAMRERQVRQLIRAGTFHAKLSPGGLVDIEYLVQMLQIQHGKRHPELRTPNTLAATDALHRCGAISVDDHRRLRAAYVFFRRLIDGLRMVRGNARDLATPAANTEEFEFLARRLGYAGQVSVLSAQLEEQAGYVTELVRRHLPDHVVLSDPVAESSGPLTPVRGGEG